MQNFFAHLFKISILSNNLEKYIYITTDKFELNTLKNQIIIITRIVNMAMAWYLFLNCIYNIRYEEYMLINNDIESMNILGVPV